MSGGGYGQQQYGPTDGFGGGKGYSLGGSQNWNNMGSVGGNMGQPSPMDQAFAPGGNMGAPAPMGGQVSGAPGGGGGGAWNNMASTGGNMGAQQPIAAQDILRTAMGKAGGAAPDWSNMGSVGGNMNGGSQPWQNVGSVGGNMGGGGGGGMVQGGGMGSVAQPTGGYGDYMNRRNSWIDQLRGYVAKPQQIQSTWGGQPGQGTAPVTSVPPGGPAPGPQSQGGVDHMANFRGLMGRDPNQAYLYGGGTGSIGAQQWAQQNQDTIRDQFFGGDQTKMAQWKQGADAQRGAIDPAAAQSLFQMSGGQPPSWALDAYRKGRAAGQPVNPMYERYL